MSAEPCAICGEEKLEEELNDCNKYNQTTQKFSIIKVCDECMIGKYYEEG